MKICVVGAGAIGGWIGAGMARAGHEVSLVARGEHLDAIRRRGLVLVSGGEARTVPASASSDPGDFGVQDAVFIALKAYSIPEMLPRLAPLLGADTVVVPAINGIPWWYFYKEGGAFDNSVLDCLDPHGAMLRALDPGHVVGCVVHGAAQVIEPGVVRHTAGDLVYLGEPDRSISARVQKLSNAMISAGFDAPVAADIRQEIWMKLIGNLSYNPVAALTLAHMDEISANERILVLIRTMMQEAMAVAEAYGITISLGIEARIEMARRIGHAKISMHQDIEKGRPLEIDAILGSVLELARRSRIATPVMDMVHALIDERARHPLTAA